MSEEVVSEKPSSFTIKEVPYVSASTLGSDLLAGVSTEVSAGFCAATWMVVRYYCPEITDEEFQAYCLLVKALLIQENEATLHNGSAEWSAQSKALYTTLTAKGVQRVQTKLWIDFVNNLGFGHFGVLEHVLRYGPVALKVKGLGGEGVGVILALYIDSDGEIVYHDPRGNALEGYDVSQDGARVKYSRDFLTPYVYEGAIPMMLVTTDAL